MVAVSKAADAAVPTLAVVSRAAWAVDTVVECSSKVAEARSSSQT